jgi:hypothetical protein
MIQGTATSSGGNIQLSTTISGTKLTCTKVIQLDICVLLCNIQSINAVFVAKMRPCYFLISYNLFFVV